MNPTNAYGTTRTVSKFLFLPKKIHGKWYWLRKYTVTQVFKKYAHVSFYNNTADWINVKYEI